MPIILQDVPQAGPVPATGSHNEALGELELAAKVLLGLIERERSGVYDGFGCSSWVGGDPVSDAAQKIVERSERVAGERRDAAATR